jgi:nucleotide-binding universal stress UspA family protein
MRILLAVDDSEHSRTAIHNLLERPWPGGTRVAVLSVAPTGLLVPGPYASEGLALTYAQLGQSMIAEAQAAADRAAAILLERASFGVETIVRQGDPRREIVEAAKDWDAELIVVGSHGRTGLQRLILGSVAEYVVRHASCSVEVSRRPKIA